MNRWYKAFRCACIDPDLLIDQIRDQVQRHNLEKIVPVVRVEKQKPGKRQRGEYYLFLAIESSHPGQIPQDVQSVLHYIPSLNSPIDGTLTLDQIKPMVRAGYELATFDNIRLIPYNPPPVQPNSDPFEQPESLPEFLNAEDALLNTRNYDRLLLWLSAVGHGSWHVFQNTCRELGLVDAKHSLTTILRGLRLLGHIETSSNRSHWSIAPSVLVKREVSDNGEEYFLCGARDTHLIQQLRAIAEVSEYPQLYGHAPATVSVRIKNIERVREHFSDSINHLHIAGTVAYQLEQRLPSLAGWMDTLQLLPGVSSYQFIVRRFTGTSFEEQPFDPDRSGMYELWRDEPPAPSMSSRSVRPDYILFYDAEKQRWLRGDWYGMRFLALQFLQKHCPIYYNSALRQLVIPQDWHWPELFERVLVLASGRLPRYEKRCLIYESISQRLLDELTPRLNLTITGDNDNA